MLSTKVKTTGDLMSIALQAEREAIKRYTRLAKNMHEGNNKSTAALFERMVIEEVEHERLLKEWMEQEDIVENASIEKITWSDPHVSTIYNDEAHDPFFSSPYKALAFAVHNEEIAFRFYTHVAANSDNKAVRQYAEVLAKEELAHAALLRAERRYAYHAERKKGSKIPKLNPKAIHHTSDLLTAAIHIDKYIAKQIKAINLTTPEFISLAEETEQQISNNETILKKSIPAGTDVIQNLDQLNLHEIEQENNHSDLNLKQLWSCCDRSFAFYDAVVEETKDEEIMLQAQKLTTTALERIGLLKKVMQEEGLN